MAAEMRRSGEGHLQLGGVPGRRIIEISDERETLAEEALRLIADSFPPHDRHPTYMLRGEIEEKRRGLLLDHNYHLLAMLGTDERPAAVVAGRYLAGLNAGFVTYLAARPEYRGRKLGRQIRSALVEAFREDARGVGEPDLAWVLGEVRLESPWLRMLFREGQAIPFDLTYYHPGMDLDDGTERYVLYRQPVLDERKVLPTDEVRQILYAIWRRAYRVPYPLQRPTFRAMIEELEGRETVGAHPEVR